MLAVCFFLHHATSATATITIKPERLTHSCVEQVFLYAWMCYTSWFELHISQDKHFNSYHLATICCVCFGYVCFGFDLKVKCLSYLMN